MAYRHNLHQAKMATDAAAEQIAPLYRLDDVRLSQLEYAAEQLDIALTSIRREIAAVLK